MKNNPKNSYQSECKIEATTTRADGDLHKELETSLLSRERLDAAIRKFNLKASTNEFASHVRVRAIEKKTFQLSFDYPDDSSGKTPELVRAVTQYLAESLVAEYAQQSATDSNRDSGDQELKQAQGKFDTANRDLVSFLDAHSAQREALQKMVNVSSGDAGSADEREFQRLVQNQKSAKAGIDDRQKALDSTRANAPARASVTLKIVEPAYRPTQVTKTN